MLYTKQQAADKINDIVALHNKGGRGHIGGTDFLNINENDILNKLNNREVISLAYMVTEPLGHETHDFNTTPIGYGSDFETSAIKQITLKMKILVLHPFGEAWTDDISMRLLSLSGLNYDQSFFDQIMNIRFAAFKANKKSSAVTDSELFEEFIRAQNDLL
jgi:hypothetical protein